MGLHKLKGVGPATVKKLNAAGVRTLDDMRGMDVSRIAKRTKLDAARLQGWQREALAVKVLEDVSGIGPAAKRKLLQAGVGDLETLARAPVQDVAHRSGIGAARISAWQKEAARLVGKGEAEVERVERGAGKSGRRAVKSTRQTATGRPERGAGFAQEAAERGRKVAAAARERGGAIRHEHESGREEAESGAGEETVTPGGVPERTATSPTNGGGFLGRLRRALLPRQS